MGPGLPRDGAQVESCLERGWGRLGTVPWVLCCPRVCVCPARGHRHRGPSTQASGQRLQFLWPKHTDQVRQQRACSLALSVASGDGADRRAHWASLLWLVLTGPPKPARHSEACPGRGRGGVLLGADVESSHQPHKSRAFFCLKPPKVPAASPVRPRPRPAPWARLVCTSPLSSLCPAAPPPPQVSRPLRPRLSHS